jgi:hypothetical protein
VSTNKKNTQQEAKNQQLILDIKGKNQAKRKTALDALQISGTSSIIRPLFDIILESGNDDNKDIIEFLSSLKQNNLKPEIIACLNDKIYLKIQPVILSCIWNMPLDFSDYISTFVQIAVNSEFMTSFECLTVLENLDGPFQESQILEAQLALRDYLENNTNESKEKAHILSEIAIIIKDIDRSLDD